MKITYVSDSFIEDMPNGGAEQVDETIIQYLRNNRGIEVIKCRSNEVLDWDTKQFYIISNFWNLGSASRFKMKYCKYILIEHDYKWCTTRNPSNWKDNLVPDSSKVFLDIYQYAKAVLLQTDFHLEVFSRNKIPGNLLSLDGSIWNDADLDEISQIRDVWYLKNPIATIYQSDNPIKNTAGAIKCCEELKFVYELIPNQSSRGEFLYKLAGNSMLVFLPRSPETMSRLAVEAKMLGCMVLTSPTYGASTAAWWDKSGHALINYMRKQSQVNLELIERLIQ